MGIWTDIAQWVGPTPNSGGAMAEYRGVILHIAEGSYAGTIAWQLNDVSNVSSHFIVAKDGRIAQMVDTDRTAWTQAAGNGRWLSIENEGNSGQSLEPAQLAANARIVAKAAAIYGIPLTSTDDVNGRGLGWHGMGGVAWGNHPNCPGVPIRNQRPEILALAAGKPEDGMLTEDEHYWLEHDSWRLTLMQSGDSNFPNVESVPADLRGKNMWAVSELKRHASTLAALVTKLDRIEGKLDALIAGGGTDGATALQVRAIVREELNKTKLPAVPGTLGV